MEDFIFRALLAAIGISIIAGSLGCFVIWRRMSYFSESISAKTTIPSDKAMCEKIPKIASLDKKSFCCKATIKVANSTGTNTDYFSLLFGDILSISNQDIIWIYTILMLVGVLLSVFWQRLLLLTLNEELGVASGLNRFAYQLLLIQIIS
jgi:zinc transport system permease protein